MGTPPLPHSSSEIRELYESVESQMGGQGIVLEAGQNDNRGPSSPPLLPHIHPRTHPPFFLFWLFDDKYVTWPQVQTEIHTSRFLCTGWQLDRAMAILYIGYVPKCPRHLVRPAFFFGVATAFFLSPAANSAWACSRVRTIA